MIDTHSISLKTIVKEFDLQVVHASTDFDSVRITVEDISRPTLTRYVCRSWAMWK